jgi:hypothetical protein
MFAAKECSRAASAPTKGDLTRLKRVGRFLLHAPRCRIRYELQDEVHTLDGEAAADAAGCTRTRRSTSGGLLRLGCHWLVGWASTQKVIGLSSGESEYYSLVRCACEAIGLAGLLRELGMTLSIELWTDATAAKSIATRVGIGGGRIKHMDTKYLWLQQKVQLKEIQVHKIKGMVNSADLMTKGLDQVTMLRHCAGLCIYLMGGRHAKAPQLSVPSESTARTARLLAALAAVLPAAGLAEEAQLEDTQSTWNVDPMMIILTFLIIAQAILFGWVGATLASRGRRAVEVKLDITTEKLKEAKEELKQARANGEKLLLSERELLKRSEALRTRAAPHAFPPRIYLNKYGERAHLSSMCESLINSKELQTMDVCWHCIKDYNTVN